MNIDFIKWMVEYAKGFEFDYHAEGHDFIKIPNKKTYCVNEIIGDPIVYPLLLQRAIEGWNRKNGIVGTRGIVQYNNDIVIYGKGNRLNTYSFEDYTEDQAKEEALKYIYEQERKTD